MKLFVAVVIFVSVSIAVADDVVWQVAEPFSLAPKIYVKENMPAPVGSVAGHTHEEVKTQDAQGNAGNPLPLREPLRPDPREEQSDALNYQSMEQLKVARKANEIAIGDNGIQERLVTVGWLTIGTMVLLTLAQLYFVWTANQHAATAALAAKESVEVAERSMKIANRAYLFVKEWEIDGLRGGSCPIVRCTIYNGGHTPAVLEKRLMWFDTGREVLPPLTPLCLSKVGKEETPVNMQDEAVGVFTTPQMTAADYQELREGSRFLYIAACFVYRDVFGQRYWVVSSVEYDVGDGTFPLIDGPDYNCDGLYREEDWPDKTN